jgi:hypothetical protein
MRCNKYEERTEAVIAQLLMAMDVSTSRHKISLWEEGSESGVVVLPDSFETRNGRKANSNAAVLLPCAVADFSVHFVVAVGKE